MNDMIGEMRLLEYFKGERERMLSAFARDDTGPPSETDVHYLAALQNAIQATKDLIGEGGFKVLMGSKPQSRFMSTGGEQ